ncbi:AmiS/UreI family transporter [Helicobacter mastomyrinus]|uniref:AmiS/UreI family transporter n=1 Tax=Helicobacter mastomyrinus TaxID=287948 RepID=A0ABZ3F9A2_9HELI|nr:AmiS/UreI family transporter [uncultured Helicobacter sp.]
MLALVLLYVGAVLINNGICRLSNIDAKTTAIMNLFVAFLSITTSIILVICASATSAEIQSFYAAAMSLLFGFTYLFIACNLLFNLDLRAYGWYSLFVALNTIPAALLSYGESFQEKAFMCIWLAWGVLWFIGFVECVLKITLKWTPYLAILEGIFTALIPAWLFFLGYWH